MNRFRTQTRKRWRVPRGRGDEPSPCAFASPKNRKRPSICCGAWTKSSSPCSSFASVCGGWLSRMDRHTNHERRAPEDETHNPARKAEGGPRPSPALPIRSWAASRRQRAMPGALGRKRACWFYRDPVGAKAASGSECGPLRKGQNNPPPDPFRTSGSDGCGGSRLRTSALLLRRLGMSGH